MSPLRRLPLRQLCTRPPTAGRGRQADQTGLGPPRFYKQVSTCAQPDGSHTVTLDGKPVRTLHNTPLAAPTHALALALAAEWDAQEGRLRPSSMPLTRLVSAARDVVAHARAAAEEELLKFVDTDTVCIRPAHPAELVAAQDAAFTPIVHHMRRRYGAKLSIARGSLAGAQGDDVWAAARGVAGAADNYSLAALGAVAACAKSCAIAVTLRDGGVDASAALAAARSEEQWQMRVWGCVEGGHDVDDADVLVRLAAAEAVFRFVEMEPERFARGEVS